MNTIEIPKTVNPDLAIERKNASFNPDEMAAFFWGRKEIVDMKRMIGKWVTKRKEEKNNNNKTYGNNNNK